MLKQPSKPVYVREFIEVRAHSNGTYSIMYRGHRDEQMRTAGLKFADHIKLIKAVGLWAHKHKDITDAQIRKSKATRETDTGEEGDCVQRPAEGG